MKKNNKAQTTLILSLVLFVVMILAAVFSDKGVVTVYDFQGELNQLKDHNSGLEQENARLKKEIKALKTEPLAVEKVAREKLQLVKPGDVVYQIVPEKTP